MSSQPLNAGRNREVTIATVEKASTVKELNLPKFLSFLWIVGGFGKIFISSIENQWIRYVLYFYTISINLVLVYGSYYMIMASVEQNPSSITFMIMVTFWVLNTGSSWIFLHINLSLHGDKFLSHLSSIEQLLRQSPNSMRNNGNYNNNAHAVKDNLNTVNKKININIVHDIDHGLDIGAGDELKLEPSINHQSLEATQGSRVYFSLTGKSIEPNNGQNTSLQMYKHFALNRYLLCVMSFVVIHNIIGLLPFCEQKLNLYSWINFVMSASFNIATMYCLDITLYYMCLLHCLQYERFARDIINGVIDTVEDGKKLYSEIIKSLEFSINSWSYAVDIAFVCTSVIAILFVIWYAFETSSSDKHAHSVSFCDSQLITFLQVFVDMSGKLVCVVYGPMMLNTTYDKRIAKVVLVDLKDKDHANVTRWHAQLTTYPTYFRVFWIPFKWNLFIALLTTIASAMVSSLIKSVVY